MLAAIAQRLVPGGTSSLHLVERASARNLMTPANLKLSIPSLLGSVSPRLITDFDAIFADEASSSDEATCEAGAPREPP